MHTTAHPDDENNGLLVMLNRGQGYRTALATATRGNGGQNEIGPEIFEALGVLRTGELAALHRFDGAEQYFTRAVDFGYSFSIEETFEKWGREEITADYVRLIRMIRPDVIITLPPTGNAGGQHHMASAVITRDAYKLAGDPAKFPEQIKDGLRPWQPRKLYHSAGFGFPGEPPHDRPGHSHQLRRLRSRCSARPTTRSAARRAACTSVRAWVSCSRFRRTPSPPPRISSSKRRCPRRCRRTRRRCSTAIDNSLGSLAAFAGPRRAEGPDRRTVGDRDGCPGGAEDVRHGQRRSNAEAAARRPVRRPFAAPQASAGWPSTRPASSRSTFACARRRTSSSRPPIIAQGVKIEVLADDGRRRAGPDGEGQRHRRESRRRRTCTVKKVKLDGFEGAADCAMMAFTGGGFGFPAEVAAAAADRAAGAADVERCARIRSRTASRR